MQGSKSGPELHTQNYRARLRAIIEAHFAQAKVYDPFENHGQSLEYNETTGREVFYQHNRMCREVEVVVAYVPEASMGTAIEIWEAHEHGKGVVITISPLAGNWAIKYSSHHLFPNLEAFESAAGSGKLAQMISDTLADRRRGSRDAIVS